MPSKAPPPRKQPARGSRSAALEDKSSKALAVPSPKESVAVDPGETRDDIVNTDTQNDQNSTQAELVSQPGDNASSSAAAASSLPPAAARRPVQRLASVLPRNPSSVDSERPTGLKFKPKSFIRRSKEEREAVEKAEAERRAARIAAEGSTASRGGNIGRGRGRGSGDRFKRLDSRQASGPMGGPSIRENINSARGRGYGGGGGGRGTRELSATSKVKREPGVKPETDKDGDVVMGSSTSKRTKAKVKKEDELPTYVSSEGELDSDTAQRVNIEKINSINLISDDESDEGISRPSEISRGKRREKTPKVHQWSMRPVRIERQEHQERAVGVNTDASSLTSAELRRRAKERQDAGGSLFLPEADEAEVLSAGRIKGRKPKDVELLRSKRKWKGVYQDEDDDTEATVKVKEEPNEYDDLMVIDTPVGVESEPMVIDGGPTGNGVVPDVVPGPGIDETLEDLPVAGDSKELLDDQPLPLNKEERPVKRGFMGILPELGEDSQDEKDILEDFPDLASLREELHAQDDDPASGPALKNLSSAIEDGKDVSTSEAKHDADREDTSYLIQLPPIIPSLRDVLRKPSIIKPEDNKKKAKTVPEAPKNPFNIHIKDDRDNAPSHAPLSTATTNAYSHPALVPVPGSVGVLTIYESGRILASWGGTPFEVNKEDHANGLAQEVVMLDWQGAVTKVEDQSRWEEVVKCGEQGWAVGHIGGGFVGMPEWGGLVG